MCRTQANCSPKLNLTHWKMDDKIAEQETMKKRNNFEKCLPELCFLHFFNISLKPAEKGRPLAK